MINSNLGYPRIGENREWKKLLEAYWSRKTTEDGLHDEMKKLRLSHLHKQKEKGIELIPVGDFTYYDHMLDHAAMFGLVPERYGYEGGPVSLDTYFAMARGNTSTTACEMTKWFNTNYHYIVPEIDGLVPPTLTENRLLQAYLEAKGELGIKGKPVIVGPYTFVKLSKGYDASRFAEVLKQMIPLYQQLLFELQGAGVEWVQIDEPSLVTSLSESDFSLLKDVYMQLHQAAPNVHTLLQTYFDSVEGYDQVIQLPVKGIGLDFVHGGEQNLQSLQTVGFPEDKRLGVGLVDGRNIWRSDLQGKLNLLQKIAEVVPVDRMILQPSCSLLHVPINLNREEKLDQTLKQALAFADEKLDEIVTLTRAIREGAAQVAEDLRANSAAVHQLAESSVRMKRDMLLEVKNYTRNRQSPFEQRRVLQNQEFQLPLLPTTTIGSFPQTLEVRRARRNWRKEEWTKEQYDVFIQAEIKKWIDLQEEIGLDVLVHGEFERTDMVEFFGEKLAGFAFTQNGWVQSYGSRCVKPPIIYGNVVFREPMTVQETEYAQSLTSKPVKGMLTGPVTILNWSFVRDDIPRRDVTAQIALALRKEVEALEAAGIRMIQVDEPALREGFPLKPKDRDSYLSWAVEAFRLATSGVKDTTQIHTHMCYCEFHDMIDAIRDLDADVISIETSRSHGELISSFETNRYDKGIGLGVYDIHSPRIPAKAEMIEMIERALRVLPTSLFWINPDCGLKTRGTPETIASLNGMIEAAQEVRSKLGESAGFSK